MVLVLPPLPSYRGCGPLICVLLRFGGGEYGFLTPQVCSCFSPPFSPAPSSFCPLKVEQFSWELRHHPNPQHVAIVLEGLRFGFKLGFGFPPSQSLKPATRNKPSAYEHPSVIDEYLATEEEDRKHRL